MIVFDSLVKVDCRVFLRFLVLPRYLIIASSDPPDAITIFQSHRVYHTNDKYG